MMLTRRQKIAVLLLFCGEALQSAPISYNETLIGARTVFVLFLAAAILWATEI
jgi:hypothetical protein